MTKENNLNPWITVTLLTFFLVAFNSLAYYYVLRLDGYFGYAHEDINLKYYYLLLAKFYILNIGIILNIWYSGLKKIYYIDCLKCTGLLSQKASICPRCHFNYGKSYGNCYRNMEEHYIIGTSIYENRFFITYPILGLIWFALIMGAMRLIDLTDFSLILFWALYLPMGLYFFIYVKNKVLGWSCLAASMIYTVIHMLVLFKDSETSILSIFSFGGIVGLAFLIWKWYGMFKEVIAKWAVLPENYWTSKDLVDEIQIDEYAKSSVVHCFECDSIVRIQEEKNSNNAKYPCPNCNAYNFKSLFKHLLNRDGLEN